MNPTSAEAWSNLGAACMLQGKFREAIAAYQKALALRPNDPSAGNGLGNALRECGRLGESAAAYRQALASLPNSAVLHTNLGSVLQGAGRLDEAMAAHRRALVINPQLARAQHNLAIALKEAGQLDEAIGASQRAIELDARAADFHANLGHALLLAGQHEAALNANRRAMSLEPDNAGWHSNYVFSLNYYPPSDGAALAAELREWNRRHAGPLAPQRFSHVPATDAGRRLRIGYVSADFRQHAVARFLEPLLCQHDRGQVEVFAYADVATADAMTQRLRSHVDTWRTTSGMADAALAGVIHADEIDILVDLALHTTPNRLLVFARKPAPIQMTWLGYPGSTGMTSMDYRLSDPYLDPAGADDEMHAEKTLRLKSCYWCYQPSEVAPEVGPPPAAQAGHVTFGCLNQFSKISPLVLLLWARILERVPRSRLLLHAPAGTCRQRALDLFAQAAIDPQRIQFEGRVQLRDYFRLYGKIDIALDTSPFAGGTTTCDALWMGVPVVTLHGQTVIGRGGASILANVGMPQLVAENEEDYVQIATELAGDIGQLERWRSEFRVKMQAWPLMDAPGFARKMEAAYRTAWRQWCVREHFK
jgi:protein O-GlcNAc transferase